MKKVKSIFIMLLLCATSFMVTSCGSMSNMSYEDAYNIGYGAGTILRNMIDN